MDLLEITLKKKEDYLLKNKEYNRFETLAHRRFAGKYIGDFVYGANDGIITTFAVVAGASGALLPSFVIVALGFSNILADGVSMGASNFLGKKSEADFAKAQRKKENWEIDHLRELEIEEVREIYKRKGFKGNDLERAVEIITSDRDVWLDTMMKDELGIIEEKDNDPTKHGIATFIAFLIAGFIPLLPYLLNVPNALFISCLVGGITLFTVGAFRSFVTTVGFIRGGLEMLIVGSVAAAVAYTAGAFIEGITK